MKRTVILGRNFGELTISALGQTIFVNDRVVGMGHYAARLLPGKYTVRSDRGESYIPDQKDVFIAIGESAALVLNAQPRLGSLSVAVDPFDARGAEISVNNEVKGNAPTSFPVIIGTHSIVARSAGFLDAVQTVSVKEGEQRKITFSMTTYEGSRQASIDAWARSKWISACAAVLAGAAAVYFQQRSNKYYDEYTTEGRSDAAQSAREKTQTNSTTSGIALGIAVAGSVSAVASWIWQTSY